MRNHPYGGVPRLPEGAIDLASLAGGAGPIEIEIGFGRADFILEWAKQRPDVRLLGVETRLKWVGLGLEKARARGLGNVSLYAGDGRRLAASIRDEGGASAVYLHFPDPWWKKRHAKRRVVTAELIADLARILADGGLLYLQTDVPERAEAYRALGEAEPTLAWSEADAVALGVRSHRERRSDEQGLPVYRLAFRRRAR